MTSIVDELAARSAQAIAQMAALEADIAACRTELAELEYSAELLRADATLAVDGKTADIRAAALVIALNDNADYTDLVQRIRDKTEQIAAYRAQFDMHRRTNRLITIQIQAMVPAARQ